MPFVGAGVDERSMLRLNGQGDIGRYGGGRGDLHLKFVVSLQKAACHCTLFLGCVY